MHAARELRRSGQSLRNIVLMGMGELLHNYEATMAALETVMDQRGLAIAPRFITLEHGRRRARIRRLDTGAAAMRCGRQPAWGDQRGTLAARAARQSLAAGTTNRRLSRLHRDAGTAHLLQWALIDGSNDGPEQATPSAACCTGLDAHVNLIPLNPTTGFDGRPAEPPASKPSGDPGRLAPASTVRQRRTASAMAAGCWLRCSLSGRSRLAGSSQGRASYK